MARDRTIGKDGGIPWKHPEDQQFFKRVTMGTALVVGRKTFDSFGRPLPGRDNIVITRNAASVAKAPNVFVVASLDEAIALASSRGATTVSVAGGGEIYAEALPIADAMILSHVPEAGGGDVFFPEFDVKQWRETSREKLGTVDVVRYARR
jgi:dihydrofolate reductase